MAYITDVIQETHIGIDEDGVEATAYTQVNFFGAMPPNGRADMILDRPFIYGIITHDDTILFIGVCENPAES
jgi:serpin B